MITITQEMLNQLTFIYNENKEKYNHWVDKALKETDPAKRKHCDKFAFVKFDDIITVFKLFFQIEIATDHIKQTITGDQQYSEHRIN